MQKQPKISVATNKAVLDIGIAYQIAQKCQ